jgi:hypothetical protein
VLGAYRLDEYAMSPASLLALAIIYALFALPVAVFLRRHP